MGRQIAAGIQFASLYVRHNSRFHDQIHTELAGRPCGKTKAVPMQIASQWDNRSFHDRFPGVFSPEDGNDARLGRPACVFMIFHTRGLVQNLLFRIVVLLDSVSVSSTWHSCTLQASVAFLPSSILLQSFFSRVIITG